MMGISRKARDQGKGIDMTGLQVIPPRLNGYDIISQMRVVQPNGRLSDTEVVILGHDPQRSTGKYVTAFVGIWSDYRIREWYWGDYSEDLGTAMRSLIRRSNASLMLCTHKEAVDQRCSYSACPNFYDPLLKVNG